MPRVGPVIRPIQGVPGYLVGTDGSLWTKWRTRRRRGGGRGVESYIGDDMKPMKLRKHNVGYLSAAFRRDGKYVYYLVHRLVLETFVGPCPEGMECLHGDGNKHNNNVGNLRWGTKVENEQDKVLHGTSRKGTEAAALVTRGKKRPPFTQEHRNNIAEAQKRRQQMLRQMRGQV
jgi:hypothetical protein